MKPFKRVQRLGEVIKEEIAEIIVRGELKDPRIGFVTITRVKVSADLAYADVFYSVMDDSWGSTGEALSDSASYIQYRLAKDLRIKRIPKLRFFEDRSLDYVDKIENLLKKVKDERLGEDPGG